MPSFPTMKNRPEGAFFTAIGALQRGYSLERRMTPMERRFVSVLAAEPTHVLTLDSRIHAREEAAHRFHLWVARMNRSRAPTRPLVYLASIAKSAEANEEAGYHVHALMWDFVNHPTATRHAKELGFGTPWIDYIAEAKTAFDYCTQVAYVLGQHQPIFATKVFARHEPLLKGKRAFLSPQRATLAEYCPKLLLALDRAKDQAVTDEMLASAVPLFSSGV